jgi:DNA-binding MarR family transcriptional regulator
LKSRGGNNRRWSNVIGAMANDPASIVDSVDRLTAAWRAAVPAYQTDTTSIFARIQHIARFFELALARVAKRHAIAAGDIYVLLALRRSAHPLTPTELFRDLSVTAGAVSKRVDRLVAAGFVKRHAHASDARSVTISITAKGRAIIEDEILFSDEFTFRAVYELSKTERETLTALLRRLLWIMEREAGEEVGEMGALLARRCGPSHPQTANSAPASD